jgi:methionyl-tRNA synthetase
MFARNCDGVVPTPGAFSAADVAILASADGLRARTRAAMDRQGLKQYLDAVWAVVADANRYFAGEEPWALRKTDPARMGTVLYVTAEVVRQVAILVQPAVPGAAARLLDLLAVPQEGRGFASLGAAGRLAPGARLPAPVAVFPRYVEQERPGEGNA